MLTLREYLIEEMKRRQLSARELSRILGEKHHSRTTKLINGEIDRPKIDYLEKLSEAWSVDLEFLVALVSPDLAQRSHMSPLARLIAERFDKLPESYQSRIANAILSIKSESSDEDLPLLREIRQITET